MPSAWVRLLAVTFFLISLPSCATMDKGGGFAFLNTYDAALRNYNSGRIMEARAIVLGMDKLREDYAKAKALLRRKIEPARKRLLRHYSRKGEEAEKAGQWYRAADMYEQAASFSTKSAALLKKAKAMGLKVRQVRLNELVRQRRSEDARLLSWMARYETPRGVHPKDEPFSRQREAYREMLDDRAGNAFSEAMWALRNDYPEVAYVMMESYLRLEPGSERGRNVMAEIKQKIPGGITVPPVEKQKPSKVKKRKKVKSVTEKQIRALMKKDDWLEARRYALVYRREGGENAQILLMAIDKKLEQKAEIAFKAGRIAFRREKLDKAVEHWSRAVELRPKNSEYVESLRRARRLQDRLRILRSEAEETEN